MIPRPFCPEIESCALALYVVYLNKKVQSEPAGQQ